jgi:hypothetical protein
MNIVILNTPDSPDASGNTVTALYASPKLGPIVDGVAKVAGYQRRTLSFATVDKCLAWASKEFNAGAPCLVSGDRVIAAPAAPAAPEKPAKGKS